MSYPISSRQFKNPDLYRLLKVLARYFQVIHKDFYVIGATASDIVLGGIHAQLTGRMTKDVDIAIAIPDWNAFREIADGLCNIAGFRKSNKQKQRFYYQDNLILDIVPFGDIATADKIFWPPENTPAMSVAGFAEMAREALSVTIDGDQTILVASLPGIFILKMIAWKDRHIEYNKDAEDIASILDNYLEINIDRAAIHNDIFSAEGFTTFTASAALMGKDIRTILSDNEPLRLHCLEIIEHEIDKEEGSLLINQILETHSIKKYEDVYQALIKVKNELNK